MYSTKSYKARTEEIPESSEIPSLNVWFNVRSTLFKSCKDGTETKFAQGFKFMAYACNDQNTLTTVANERLKQKNEDVKLTRFKRVLYASYNSKKCFF